MPSGHGGLSNPERGRKPHLGAEMVEGFDVGHISTGLSPEQYPRVNSAVDYFCAVSHVPNKRTRKPPRATKGSVGYRLWDTRIKADLTQQALSKLSGVGQSAISSLENGESKWMQSPTLVKLALALHVQPHWLETGKGETIPIVTGDGPTLLSIWQNLDPRQRVAWMTYGEYLLSQKTPKGGKATG